VGSFGVEGKRAERRRLVGPSETVHPLDLSASGLPHFAGTLVLERDVALTDETAHLALNAGEERFLDCAEVSLEGRSLGVRCWPPFRWALPEELRGVGEVTVRLEITTSAGAAIEGKRFDMDAGEYVEL
jgi:hypothetical protein